MPDRPGRPRDLVAFVLPSVIGSGGGDVEDVRAAAWVLRHAGVPVRWFGPPGTPRPVASSELGDWPVRRVERTLPAEGGRALTVSSQFGVTAEGPRTGRLGAAGGWWPAVAAIEERYGRDRVLHVSLEEFSRNLSANDQELERWREGGRTRLEIRRRRHRRSWTADVDRMRRLFHRYHALGRRNLVPVFPTFRPSRGFRQDFPTAWEIGPILPPRRVASHPRGRRRPRERRWLWYASPSSSSRVLPKIVAAAAEEPGHLLLEVRSPRPLASQRPSPRVAVRRVRTLPRRLWERRMSEADLRIVTGGRSLIEAVGAGSPFLYFNGVTGSGTRQRTHRPEKLRALLAAGRSAGVDPGVLRDLTDFARVRRVGPIVHRALTRPGWARAFARFPRVLGPRSRLPPGNSALAALAIAWSQWPGTASAFRTSWETRRGPRGVRNLLPSRA